MAAVEATSGVTEREAIDLLRKVIAVKCETEHRIWERELANLYADIMREFGMEVETFEVEPERTNVIGRVRGSGGGKSILFNGHIMCPVSNLEDWHCDPYAAVIEDGKIYGMGVADLKAAAVSMLFAARDAARHRPKGDVIIGLGAGGELGGMIGTKAMLERGLRADCAVVGEPSELDIVYVERGAVWYEWFVRGRTGLTGKAGSLNANHKAIKIANALIALNDEIGRNAHPLVGRGQLSLNYITGGTEFYNVPDRCYMKSDRRLVPGETLEGAIAQIEGLAERLRAEDPELDFTFTRRLQIPPVETALDSLIVRQTIEVITEVRGRKPQLNGIFGFTEMAHIHAAGIPAIVLGPGSFKVIHAPNEYVEVREFMEATAVYTGLVRRITSILA